LTDRLADCLCERSGGGSDHPARITFRGLCSPADDECLTVQEHPEHRLGAGLRFEWNQRYNNGVFFKSHRAPIIMTDQPDSKYCLLKRSIPNWSAGKRIQPGSGDHLGCNSSPEHSPLPGVSQVGYHIGISVSGHSFWRPTTDDRRRQIPLSMAGLINDSSQSLGDALAPCRNAGSSTPSRVGQWGRGLLRMEVGRRGGGRKHGGSQAVRLLSKATSPFRWPGHERVTGAGARVRPRSCSSDRSISVTESAPHRCPGFVTPCRQQGVCGIYMEAAFPAIPA
jgi:hypothetical protein